MALQPTFEDILGCQSALFEWAESYDRKDWDRLAKCIAPTLRIDYRAFIDKLWEKMSALEFIDMASSPGFLGNSRLKTQHLVGVTRWEKISDSEILGHHQMRVAHQKYADDGLQEVIAKGHQHGSAVMNYRQVDGVWKLGGITPLVGWQEFDGNGLFDDGKKEIGKKKEPE